MISPRIRGRGVVYFAQGAAKLRSCTPNKIEARVEGGATYEVELLRAETRVLYSCTCPYFDQNAELCKHLWATLLAASARIDLAPWAARGVDWIPATESDEWPEDEDHDEEEDDDDEGEDAEPAKSVKGSGRGTWRPQGSAAPPAPRPPPVAPWRRLIAELEQTSVERARSAAEVRGSGRREILYLLERSQIGRRARLQLSCELRTGGRDGVWRAPKPLRLTRGQLELLDDPEDRALVGLLAGFVPGASSGYGYGYFDDYRLRELVGTRFELEPFQLEALAPRLAATGRFRARAPGADGKLELGPPLAWRPEPWRLRLRVRRDPEAAGSAAADYLVEPELVLGDVAAPSDSALWLVPGGAVVGRDWVAPLDDAGLFSWLRLESGVESGTESPIVVPAAEIDDWLAALHRLPRVPPLDLPPELALARVVEPPRRRLEIGAPGRESSWSAHERFPAHLAFRYGDELVRVADARELLLELPLRRQRRRDRALEAAAFERLFELGALPPSAGQRGRADFELAPKSVPGVVRALLLEGWEVEAEGRRFRTPGRTALAVTSGIDWFELGGGVEYGVETAQLPALLAALRSGTQMVALGDGSFGLLPEEWLVRHALLGEIGEAKGDRIRFSRPQAALIDSWLGAEGEVSFDAEFSKLKKELAGFAGIAPAEPPRAFRGQLRDYQKEGLGWLLFLQRFGLGGCLADDMGLGKTVQILALLVGRRRARENAGGERRPTLVVVPRSLLFNWRQEAVRFAPSLSVYEHHGLGRAQEPAELLRHDLVLTTYGTLRSDVELFAAIELDYCVLDEAQAIKNEKTAGAKAARRIRARHRLVATGTPIENHLGELWSLLEFLNPGLLGRSSLFRTSTGAARKLPDESRARLARGLRPYLLRRTKAEVAPELPAKTEQTLLCELEGAQRKLYDELRDYYRRSLAAKVARQGWAKSKIHVLEALLRLRQAACHPGLIDPHRAKDESAKFEALLPRLDELREEGHKTLVFSQFTSLLALLRQRLDARHWVYEYLDGATVDRQERVERFQSDPDCPLFLISLKAGGLGLNLTAAEYVFLLDPWWNPAVEAQAIDRTHRIGQTRAVFAYRLIAKGTVEERIVELQAQKRELADALLGGNQAPLADLRREDLDLLLG